MVKMELKSHLHRWELHMAVPLVKLSLGKSENTDTNAKEFRDCATTFASFYTVKAVCGGKNDRKWITLIFHFEVCIVAIIVIVYFSSFDQSYWLLLSLLFFHSHCRFSKPFSTILNSVCELLICLFKCFFCVCLSHIQLLLCVTPIGIPSYLLKFPS